MIRLFRKALCRFCVGWAVALSGAFFGPGAQACGRDNPINAYIMDTDRSVPYLYLGVASPQHPDAMVMWQDDDGLPTLLLLAQVAKQDSPSLDKYADVVRISLERLGHGLELSLGQLKNQKSEQYDHLKSLADAVARLRQQFPPRLDQAFFQTFVQECGKDVAWLVENKTFQYPKLEIVKGGQLQNTVLSADVYEPFRDFLDDVGKSAPRDCAGYHLAN